MTFGASGRILLLSNETPLGPAGKPRRDFHWTDANGGVPNKYSWDAEYNHASYNLGPLCNL